MRQRKLKCILASVTLLACFALNMGLPLSANGAGEGFETCKKLNWTEFGFRNQGECVALLATGGMIWNLDSDFSISPNYANPNPDRHGNNDVWWFQYNPTGLQRDPASFVLLPNFTQVDPNREQWDDGAPAPSPFPEIGLVKNLATMVVHPDFDQLIVVGWRSPINGTVKIRGSLRHVGGVGVNSNGIRWFIDHYNGTDISTIDSGVLDVDESLDFGLDFTADVNIGDFIYVSVDPRPNIGPGDADFDSTLLDLTIMGPTPPTN